MSRVQDNYTLQDIVTRINGGDYIPNGETSYDEGAYDRMMAIENLIDWLLEGFSYVCKFRVRQEYSYQKAGKEAEKYLRDIRERIDDMLEESEDQV